ncbi:unnamed protein product [Meloidogyne enterolobii]|uniref:Uncharacterized protein n=1 Tax=Meloidogyne enterolobii TaxID=390850 RepID=A0ACB0ZXD4_MELEN
MVGWNNMGTDCRVEKSGVFGHAALLGADSEKMIQDGDDSMGFELAITEKGGLNVTVDGKKIKGDGPPGPMFPGPPRSTNLTESRPCLAEGEDVAEPLTWKITGKTPAFDPGYSRLLVFYLLPQVSARVGKVFVPKGQEGLHAFGC